MGGEGEVSYIHVQNHPRILSQRRDPSSSLRAKRRWECACVRSRSAVFRGQMARGQNRDDMQTRSRPSPSLGPHPAAATSPGSLNPVPTPRCLRSSLSPRKAADVSSARADGKSKFLFSLCLYSKAPWEIKAPCQLDKE